MCVITDVTISQKEGKVKIQKIWRDIILVGRGMLSP